MISGSSGPAPERIYNPRGSIYTPIMELGSQNHSRDGLLGPNSIIVAYMDPLGMETIGSVTLDDIKSRITHDTEYTMNLRV